MQRQRISFNALLLTLLCVCTFLSGGVDACPKYTDEPKKFGSINLYFEDTTTVEYQFLRYKLDSFYKIQVARGFNGSVLIGYLRALFWPCR